jgi:LysR family transcriptional regulator, carnitine catabolism transcriptional activator
MNISLKHHQLTCFLAIAEEGSFSKAAQRLAVSQPALSRTIILMEEMIGARLFDRNTRNVSLTPVGIELTSLARRVVSEIDGLAGELGRFVEGRRGRITVAALPSVAAILLPAAIARFSIDAPEVDIRIKDGLSEKVLEAVEAGEADLGITVKSPSKGRLVHHPLCSDELGLVCRNDDPLARSDSVDWSVFEHRPFVAMASDSSVRLATDTAFIQAGIQVTPLFECSFLGTTGHLVAEGLGISALPRLTCPLTGAANLVWRRLEAPRVDRMIGIVVRSDRTLSPSATKFLAILKGVAKALDKRPEVLSDA